ncbi:efflux RND transporter periplasmic adaptor subunit [Desulfotalea psychrophila]|uniref:Efflux RND transporter periplasmic adaptor subunit n=1 Tax=Desulfotalea psychrophila TaxID=84980 RepID=A0ABS3AXC4_9BACT|nr:efflux RND transporter periplasmic adaptor subunit [Desulfocapsa sp.]MBN4068537.1 efflux RND transporter periplasmic adaptor subunit [Desulfotalea psychrophila]MBN4071597.1 efflux RND transporter periplasmic adaptor subunit [Desulfotalea psychrophila]
MNNKKTSIHLTMAALALLLAVFTSSIVVAASTESNEPLFYRNPMNPAITSPVPAKDDMGMDYIPVYADAEDSMGPAGTVKIDPVLVQKIGVRIGMAMERSMSRLITAPARVTFNEESLAMVHSKFSGWAEQVMVNKTGEYVRKGQTLLSIYSPELVSTQEEYLLAMANARVLNLSSMKEIRDDARRLVESTRKRLAYFDIPEKVIRQLEQSGEVQRDLPIDSPFSGTVIDIGVEAGHFITPKQRLYRIVDLSTVWVYADVYEPDLPWIREDDMAMISVASQPGKKFSGTIDYVYPYEEGTTRTVRVRLIFDNKNGMLKPGMFADITIHAGKRDKVLAVPSEAIVRSGDKEQVFVVTGPGTFEPREVVTGVQADSYVEIIRGLKQHESVVTSAQFLIDSESKLREATAKMIEANKAASKNDEMDDMQKK